jgi:hypothetical protein
MEQQRLQQQDLEAQEEQPVVAVAVVVQIVIT